MHRFAFSGVTQQYNYLHDADSAERVSKGT